jgi:hypothetical protein
MLHISISTQRLYKNYVDCKFQKTILLQCTMYTLQNQTKLKQVNEVTRWGARFSTFKVCKKRDRLVLIAVTKHCYVDLRDPSYYWIWFLTNPTHVSPQLALQVHRNNAWISNQKTKWHLGPSLGGWQRQLGFWEWTCNDITQSFVLIFGLNLWWYGCLMLM